MRPFILFLKRVGLQKIVGVFIAIVLIMVASLYILNRPSALPDNSQAKFDNGEYAKSIPELEAWVQKNPDDLNSKELLAASYIQKADAEPVKAKGELAKAIKILNQIVKKDQNRSETYRLLGVARLYQNNIPAAEANFDRAVDVSKGQNLEAQVGLGMISENKGDWDKAINIYTLVLTKDPTNEMAILGTGRYYIHTKNYTLVRKSINALLLSTKNNAVKGEAYAILGSSFVLTKDFRGAADNFEKSLSYRPGNVHTQVLLGEALIGQYQSAPPTQWSSLIKQITDVADKAILTKPDYIYAHALLYKVNLLQNKYPEANQIGKKIVSLLKNDKILSDAEKAEYAKYYSEEISSVTITSLKKPTAYDSNASTTKASKATPVTKTTNNIKK